MSLEILKKLSSYFSLHGHKIYLVGGTTRDYLLNRNLTDLDFATDASPSELKELFKEEKTPFIHLGSITVKYEGVKVDITCFREEDDYIDYRHPRTLKFIKSLTKDAARRDFTINAMYLDENENLYDVYNGIQDLKDKLIRVIGDGEKRFKEDPLRIVRAIRFALLLDFDIEESTSLSMIKHSGLLLKLTKEKVLNELRKAKKINEDKYYQLLRKYNIDENDFV